MNWHRLVAALASVGLVSIVSSCNLDYPTSSPSAVIVTLNAGTTGSSAGPSTGSLTGPLINQGLIGVNGPGPVGAQALIKNLGVDWVRVGTSLGANYNCATGVWDPTNLDQSVAGVLAEGGVPEIDVGGTPTCLATPTGNSGFGPQNDPPDIGSQNRQAWMSLVYQMAYHEITTYGVAIFEIENEPDWVFWNGTMQEYFQVYNDTATAIEQAASKANVKVMVGGPTLANIFDSMDTSWLDPFLQYVSSHNLPLDFLSWHSYPNDPLAGPGPSPGEGPYCLGNQPGPNGNTCYYNKSLDPGTPAQEARQARQALANYPNLHPLLVIDEWNLNGEYDARQSGPYDAAFALDVLTQAQQAGVDRMCFWDVNDSASDPLNNWGLLTSNLEPKPVYYSFLFWHDIAGQSLPISFDPGGTSADPLGQVGGVASRSASGKLSVLLYNFQPYDVSGNYGTSDPTPTDHQVVLDLTGLAANSAYAWNRMAVDATHTGSTIATGTLTSSAGNAQMIFDIPGDSVSLVTLNLKP